MSIILIFRLKHLLLANTNFIIGAFPAKDAFKILGHLEELDISGNKLDSHGATESVAHLCSISTNLKILNVSNCYLSNANAQELLEKLAKNTKLAGVDLNLSLNPITLLDLGVL